MFFLQLQRKDGHDAAIMQMDSLDKHVEQISFQQFVTFLEHGQLKGWQPVAKTSISTHCNSRHGKMKKKNTLPVAIFPNTLETTTLTRPMLLCMRQVFFSKAATKGWDLLQA